MRSGSRYQRARLGFKYGWHEVGKIRLQLTVRWRAKAPENVIEDRSRDLS